MVDFVLNAQVREDKGKGASRRLRRLANQVPAIIYGGSKEPANISIGHFEVDYALGNEAVYSHIITINIDGAGTEEVILKAVQRHPSKPQILHLDFLRINKDQKLNTKVPLHFLNEAGCKGVKAGGIVYRNITELDILCLPKDLPEAIEIDLSDLEIGGIVHIADIKLPKGVESVDLSHGPEHNHPVVSVIKPRGAAEEEESSEEEAE
ncbi:MAG: 50S ribosomal protein L25/general stress protein Ctc [Porticoccaceae bacterium]